MQETDRTVIEDAEQFRRVWQRVQSGREEPPQQPAQSTPSENAPCWDPVPFLQECISQARLREACCRRWNRLTPFATLYRSQARRLTAALFLLRGIRPMRAQAVSALRWPSLEESCRQLFLWERRAETGYQSALSRTQDPELRALFRELARESGMLQQRLRLTLEDAMD